LVVFCAWSANPEQFVRSINGSGYAGTQLVPPEHWCVVTGHGLAISAVAAYQPLTDGLNPRDQHDRIKQRICTNIVDTAQTEHF
jgi:hypothetical protein